MAVTVEQIRKQAQEELVRVEALRQYLVKSLPLRATGGGHIFNELGKTEAVLKNLAQVEVEVEAPEETPEP